MSTGYIAPPAGQSPYLYYQALLDQVYHRAARDPLGFRVRCGVLFALLGLQIVLSLGYLALLLEAATVSHLLKHHNKRLWLFARVARGGGTLIVTK